LTLRYFGVAVCCRRRFAPFDDAQGALSEVERRPAAKRADWLLGVTRLRCPALVGSYGEATP
jgi:hypothetical protein